MTLPSLRELLPGDWDAFRKQLEVVHEQSFRGAPDIEPFDLTSLEVPEDVLRPIVQANRRRIRGEMTRDELMGPDSRYSSLDELDEQLADLLVASAHRYEPREYVRQVIQLARQFLSLNAALRMTPTAQRLDVRDAAGCLEEIQTAWANADSDVREILDLLVMDLTHGGDEPWVGQLPSDEKQFVSDVLARQAGQ